MSTDVILLLVIGAAVGAYFIFFKEKKQQYSNDKLKEIFIQVSKILEPHEEDHDFIVIRKKKLLDDINREKIFSIRVPPLYTKEEIDAFEKMVSETKQEMKNVCDQLKEHKPALISFIAVTEETIQKTLDGIEKIKNEEQDEDTDDALDIFERHVESSNAKLPKLQAELIKLEKSLIKYHNI